MRHYVMCELSCVKPSFRSLKSIGNYSLVGCKLGKGSFARVELAKHGLTGLKVALKIFDPSKINDENSKTRLYREASILKRLRHNNIIHLYETLRYGDIYCLVTEAAFGGNLKAFISRQKNGVLRNDVGRHLFKQLTLAVSYLHTNGIVHRDLKTDNILLDKNHDTIKLADFGLSNKFTFDQLLNTHCGSPEYAAPELFNRDGYHGPAVDIWSMGIVLFAMLMGKLPFTPEKRTLNAKEQLLIQLRKGYTVLHHHTTRKLSIGAQYLLEKTLESDPCKRFTIHDVNNSGWLSREGEKNVHLTTKRQSVSIENEVKEKTIGIFGLSSSQLDEVKDPCRCDAVSATYNILLDNLMNANAHKVDAASGTCKPVENQNSWCKHNGSAGSKSRGKTSHESFSKNSCRASRSCSIPSPRTRLRKKDTNQLRVMGRKTSHNEVNKEDSEFTKDPQRSLFMENVSPQCRLQGFMSTDATYVAPKAQSIASKHAITSTPPTKLNRHQEIIKQILSNATDNPIDINRIRHLVRNDSRNSTLRCKSALESRKKKSAPPLENINVADLNSLPQAECSVVSSDQSGGFKQRVDDLQGYAHVDERFENKMTDLKLASNAKEDSQLRSNSPFMARMMSHRVAMPIASASVYTGQSAGKWQDKIDQNTKGNKRSRSVPIKKYVDTKSVVFNVKPMKVSSENKMRLTAKVPIPDKNISVTSTPVATPYVTPGNSRPNTRPNSNCKTKMKRISRPTSSLPSTLSTKTHAIRTIAETLDDSHKQIPTLHRSKLQSDDKTVERKGIKKMNFTDTSTGNRYEEFLPTSITCKPNDQLEKVWCDSYRESIIEWYKQKTHTDDRGLALVRKVYYNIDGAIKESNTKHCETDHQYRLGIARNSNVYNRR